MCQASIKMYAILSSSSHHVSPCELSWSARRLPRVPRLRAPNNSSENICIATVCRILNWTPLISVVRLSGGITAPENYMGAGGWVIFYSNYEISIQSYIYIICPKSIYVRGPQRTSKQSPQMTLGWIQERVQKLLPGMILDQFLSSSDFFRILKKYWSLSIPICIERKHSTHSSGIAKENVDYCNVFFKCIISTRSCLQLACSQDLDEEKERL